MFRRIARIAAVAALAVLPWVSTPSQAQEWRGWNIHPPDYPVSRGMDRFTQLVAERTNNRIRMRTFHSAQLGQQDEAIQQMRLGSIDFAEFNMSGLNNIVPSTQIFTLPFIFRDVAHQHMVVDGPIGEDIGKDLTDAGFVVLAWYDAGARSMYGRRPINTPEDMRGLKVRVQTSDLWIDIMKALGANATPLPYGEVYTSLQSGVLDAAENNWPSYESSRHFEVARYFTTTEHSNVPEILAVSRQRWNRLNAADREIVRTAARESATFQRQLWAEREQISRDRVIAGGAQINEITDRAPWQRLMEPVYAKYAADARMADLVRRIREAR